MLSRPSGKRTSKLQHWGTASCLRKRMPVYRGRLVSELVRGSHLPLWRNSTSEPLPR